MNLSRYIVTIGGLKFPRTLGERICAVDLFDAAVQAGQEYSIPKEEDLTVSHSVPVQRSPCFFEGFLADDPNA
jgi:hypothetical protein